MSRCFTLYTIYVCIEIPVKPVTEFLFRKSPLYDPVNNSYGFCFDSEIEVYAFLHNVITIIEDFITKDTYYPNNCVKIASRSRSYELEDYDIFVVNNGNTQCDVELHYRSLGSKGERTIYSRMAVPESISMLKTLFTVKLSELGDNGL